MLHIIMLYIMAERLSLEKTRIAVNVTAFNLSVKMTMMHVSRTLSDNHKRNKDDVLNRIIHYSGCGMGKFL